MNSTSSGFLHFLSAKMHTGMSVEKKQVGGQADHCVDVAVLEQLGTNTRFHATTEQHAMRQDDSHHAIGLEVMETMQQKSQVGFDPKALRPVQ